MEEDSTKISQSKEEKKSVKEIIEELKEFKTRNFKKKVVQIKTVSGYPIETKLWYSDSPRNFENKKK